MLWLHFVDSHFWWAAVQSSGEVLGTKDVRMKMSIRIETKSFSIRVQLERRITCWDVPNPNRLVEYLYRITLRVLNSKISISLTTSLRLVVIA